MKCLFWRANLSLQAAWRHSCCCLSTVRESGRERGDFLKCSFSLIYSHNVKHAVPSSDVCRLISSALINHGVLAKQSGNKWRFDQSCRWAFKPPYASCSFLTQRSKHIVLSRIRNGRKPIQTHVWSPRSVSYFTVGHYCSFMWNQ